MTLLFSMNMNMAWGENGAAPANANMLPLLGVS